MEHHLKGPLILLVWLSCCWVMPTVGFSEDLATIVSQGYHDYNKLTRFLEELHNENKDITSLYSIGESVQGRQLWVLELTKNVSAPNLLIPNVKLIGNIHGDEPIGKEVLIDMIKYLIREYRNGGTQVVRLLERTRVHILPSLNPDGFERTDQFSCDTFRRKGSNNENGVDLNANFPGVFQKNNQEEQPETRAVKKWLTDKRFVLSMNFQSGNGPLVYYPYDSCPKDTDCKESVTEDDELFRKLAKDYASNNIKMGDRKYMNGVTFFGSFSGSMMDYNYHYHGCLEINVELHHCFYFDYEEISFIWNENKKSILNFIEEANRGVRGIVRDKDTGLGIPGAKILIDNRKIPVFTTNRGEYWKTLIGEGRTYYIRVIAEGYENKSSKFTLSGDQVNKNFELTKVKKKNTMTSAGHELMAAHRTGATATTPRTTTSSEFGYEPEVVAL